MKTSDIKRVIDSGLSNVVTTERDVDALMEYILNADSRERRPVRKIPMAAVIALVLLLIGTAAFAAMSFLGVFEQAFRITEEEQVDEIHNWSFDHKMELVDLLLEAGTDFNLDMLMQVYSDELTEEEKSALINEMLMDRFPPSDGYWSVTALSMLFTEKGLPHQWTHEERAWFGDLLSLLMDEIYSWRYVLPTENDMSEEEALEIAYQYFYDHYGLSRDCFDPEQQYACFAERLEEDNVLKRHWKIKLNLLIDKYDGNQLIHPEVQLCIQEDGSLFDICGPSVRTWRDDWSDTYGSDGFWTIEGLYAFQLEWRPRVEQLLEEGESINKVLKYLVSKEFGLPDSSSIPLEEAREIARITILAQDDWTEEMLSAYNYREAYIVGESDQYCMLYTLAHLPATEYNDNLWTMNANGEIPYSIRVCIDAVTGTVLEVFQLDQQTNVIDTIGI